MEKVFMMKLSDIQPSQLYICSEKLSEVMKTFNPNDPKSMEPIPIKKLDEDIIFVDGHTRAFAAFLHGFTEIPVYWENEELDWDMYKICVEWCKNEGICTIADLKNRVIPQGEYEILWYKRCEELEQKLKANREHDES
ncbi:MAG: ParB/Srx family N-terminal domain-containing protein [Candidatus Methanomethylicia archaeon]